MEPLQIIWLLQRFSILDNLQHSSDLFKPWINTFLWIFFISNYYITDYLELVNFLWRYVASWGVLYMIPSWKFSNMVEIVVFLIVLQILLKFLYDVVLLLEVSWHNFFLINMLHIFILLRFYRGLYSIHVKFTIEGTWKKTNSMVKCICILAFRQARVLVVILDKTRILYIWSVRSLSSQVCNSPTKQAWWI